VKSFYYLFLPIALNFILNCFTPVMAETIYKKKSASELTEEKFTYAFSVKTSFGTMDIEIHATEKNEAYVKRVAQILSEDGKKVIEYFGYVPWNTLHILVDRFVSDRVSDRANGAATVRPRPWIQLNTAPPHGVEHLVTRGDWVKTLVLHELIHILHLDQTSGFMKFLRYFMGSDGKLNGVTPRWFAEGIATWGEAKFTNGGRLTRGLFNFDFKNRMISKNFCQSSVCIDDPGVYPFGSSAYWVGSHFSKWIEDRKPGAIACLVRENSNNIPGFLSWAFKDCLGKDYQSLFSIFRAEIVKSIEKEMKSFRKTSLAKSFNQIKLRKTEHPIFSSGVQLVKDKIYVNQINDLREDHLKVINLSKKSKESLRLPDVIESILPNTHEDYLILRSYREFSSENPINWLLFSTKKKKVVKRISWPKAKYLFRFEDGSYLGILFNNNTWEIWERRDGKDELIFDLPPMATLYNPEVVERDGKRFVSFRYFDFKARPNHEYLRVDLDTAKDEVLFQSDDSLEVVGSCGTHRLLKTTENIYSVNIRNGYVSNLKDELKSIAHLKGNNQYTVVLFEKDPERIYAAKVDCEKWLDDNSGIELKKDETSAPASEINYIEDKSSYPEWDHFLPHRWGIGYSGGDSTAGWTFSTSINDPGNVHNISGSYKIYSGNDENGGSASYLYNNNYFSLSSSYYKEFLTSNTKSTPDSIEMVRAVLLKDYYFGWLRLIPSLAYSKGRTIDFISNRKFQSYVGGLSFATENIHSDDLLRSASLDLSVAQTDTIGRLDYLSYRGRARIDLHPSYKFDILTQATYEKLDKNDLSSGVAYAGGANDFSGYSFHEFYGIQSNDAFGNEVYTGKLEFNYLIHDVYSGPKYIPLFIRRIKGILGTGLLKTDFIFIDSDKRFLRDKMLSNLYVGFGTEFTILYGGRVRLDILLTKIMSDSIINDQIQQLALIKGSF
jgi:hypothetical protein